MGRDALSCAVHSAICRLHYLTAGSANGNKQHPNACPYLEWHVHEATRVAAGRNTGTPHQPERSESDREHSPLFLLTRSEQRPSLRKQTLGRSTLDLKEEILGRPQELDSDFHGQSDQGQETDVPECSAVPLCGISGLHKTQPYGEGRHQQKMSRLEISCRLHHEEDVPSSVFHI